MDKMTIGPKGLKYLIIGFVVMVAGYVLMMGGMDFRHSRCWNTEAH